MYADQQDMVDRFGEQEIIQLTDRSLTQSNSIDVTLLEAKIADAVSEINLELSCCFDLKKVKKVYDDGGFIPILKQWTVDVTRKHLYDSLENDNNQVNREYRDYEEEIKKLCECGELYDNEYNVVPKKNVAFFSEDAGCYPKMPCCCDEPCGCKQWAE